MERQIETVRESVMGQYEWIVLGKESRKERKKTIGKIRSHAMRETAASRKRSGTWGKHNQRQYPVEPVPSFSATECIPSDLPPAVPARRSGDKGNEPYFKLRLGLPMPLSGLDQLATEIGVNVLDLSALTTIHIGQTAMSFLMNDPNHLVGLVSVRKSSYLTHVATRYGSSYCLDDAVRCVATKAHRLLVGIGNGGRTLELTSYGKALRSLQTAIDLEQEWRNPEVLCAVQVLSLFEVGNSVYSCFDLVLNTHFRHLSYLRPAHGRSILPVHLASFAQEGRQVFNQTLRSCCSIQSPVQ